ncbi:hypothetical protein JK628_03605 [Shewanella sp. KX20019]|uniref:hypothetical protein n=1 Tax=Shewanella sp. KX20019 TaxID=2803864 RepID=UPI0019295210|nr:hypothetical protein [Shewanella sp. KX20019]QQX80969.1 hypothetical protein JK628_03605 [Shewanella sp. KX20019]
MGNNKNYFEIKCNALKSIGISDRDISIMEETINAEFSRGNKKVTISDSNKDESNGNVVNYIKIPIKNANEYLTLFSHPNKGSLHQQVIKSMQRTNNFNELEFIESHSVHSKLLHYMYVDNNDKTTEDFLNRHYFPRTINAFAARNVNVPDGATLTISGTEDQEPVLVVLDELTIGDDASIEWETAGTLITEKTIYPEVEAGGNFNNDGGHGGEGGAASPAQNGKDGQEGKNGESILGICSRDPGTGSHGSDGSNGGNGGKGGNGGDALPVTWHSKEITGVIRVSANGGNGGLGSMGADGGNGGNGGRSGNNPGTCAPVFGGNGGNGGNGGIGGDGGAGGAGGNLNITFDIGIPRIDSSSNGGNAGKAGQAGGGGVAGQGGTGRPTGDNGKQGSPGSPGAGGVGGHAGAVNINGEVIQSI